MPGTDGYRVLMASFKHLGGHTNGLSLDVQNSNQETDGPMRSLIHDYMEQELLT